MPAFDYKVIAGITATLITVPHLKAIIHGRPLTMQYHLAMFKKS